MKQLLFLDYILPIAMCIQIGAPPVQKVFSVHDSKAEAFLPPFYCPTLGVAVRNFKAAVADPQHTFHHHAEDFTLFELGTWDEQGGYFELHPSPIAHGNGVQFRGDPIPVDEELAEQIRDQVDLEHDQAVKNIKALTPQQLREANELSIEKAKARA